MKMYWFHKHKIKLLGFVSGNSQESWAVILFCHWLPWQAWKSPFPSLGLKSYFCNMGPFITLDPWYPNLAVHWNYLGSFQKSLMPVSHPPKDCDFLGLGCGLCLFERLHRWLCRQVRESLDSKISEAFPSRDGLRVSDSLPLPRAVYPWISVPFLATDKKEYSKTYLSDPFWCLAIVLTEYIFFVSKFLLWQFKPRWEKRTSSYDWICCWITRMNLHHQLWSLPAYN